MRFLSCVVASMLALYHISIAADTIIPRPAKPDLADKLAPKIMIVSMASLSHRDVVLRC